MRKRATAAFGDLTLALQRPRRKKRGWRKTTDIKKASATLAAVKARASEMEIGEYETPLEFLLAVMRSRELPLKTRLEAAKFALPYVHGRMVSDKNPNVAAVGPERSSAEIREDLRRLLTAMGIDPAVIEAIVGPTSNVGASAPRSATRHIRVVEPR
jgi:hypothetical protein